MRGVALRPRPPIRQVTLVLLAIAVVVLPPAAFSVVTEIAWEVQILKMLALVGLSLLAAIPWASTTGGKVRRRLRRWSVPGVAASVVYLVSTDPVYLFLGFCLLVGAAVDVWMARAHVAAESLRVRLSSQRRIEP